MAGRLSQIQWRRVVTIALGVLAGLVATAGTSAVAVAGFTLSYDAIRKVGVASGVRPGWAWLLPVSIDGAMAVGTVTATVMSRMGRKVWYPWLVVLAGAGISIACNAVHAKMREHIQLDDRTAMAVSAIPAVMLALSIHLLVVLVDAAALTVEGDPKSDQGGTPTDQVGDQGDLNPDLKATMVASGRPQVASWSLDSGDGYDDEMPTDPWGYSTPAMGPDQTGDHTADLRDLNGDQNDQNDEQTDLRPRPDGDLVAEFGDQLRTMRASGRLTRYAVEQTTKAARRQAERILDLIVAEGDQSDLNPDQSDLNGDLVAATAGPKEATK